MHKKCQFRSYSGQHFPAFGLSTERYRVSLRIQSECGKMRTRKSRNTDTFHKVNNFSIAKSLRVKEVLAMKLFY